MGYGDRDAAGRDLAAWLEHLRAPAPLVLGLPRGGVPVAAAVRAVLGGDLDILLVRKIGVPWQPELAMGAIGEGGARVTNPDVIAHAELEPGEWDRIEAAERAELERRRALWRAAAPPLPLTDRVTILVDDGMATGATVAVACRVARLHRPARLVVAVPVSSLEAVRRVEGEADEVICPWIPETLGGVGAAYADFHQLADSEVTALLR